MNARKRCILFGGAAALLLPLLMFKSIPTGRAAEGDEVEYTFGRPVQKDEKTYEWYRGTHAAEAAQRYGVDPAAVGDGMDTWHWWVGVDNPGFWRNMSILTSGKGSNPVDARVDFLSVIMQPRADRWKKMGLINDPDTVAAEKPDKYGLMISLGTQRCSVIPAGSSDCSSSSTRSSTPANGQLKSTWKTPARSSHLIWLAWHAAFATSPSTRTSRHKIPSTRNGRI